MKGLRILAEDCHSIQKILLLASRFDKTNVSDLPFAVLDLVLIPSTKMKKASCLTLAKPFNNNLE